MEALPEKSEEVIETNNEKESELNAENQIKIEDKGKEGKQHITSL